MRRLRVLVVSAVVGVATFGLPGHARAQAPASLDAVVRIPGAIPAGARIARSVALPWRANLVAMSFLSGDPEAAGVVIRIRARTPDGRGRWTALVVTPDEGPEGAERRRARARVFTEPLWVGLADAIEVRVEGSEDARPVRDLRLHLVNSAGDARPSSGLLRALRGIGGFLSAPMAPPAEAHPMQPGIVSRRQWGADESLRDGGPDYADAVKAVFIHHTAGSNSYARSESAAIVRAIYRYHVRARGFSDIAYNFLVDRYGQVFEGRYGGMEEPVIGGHTMGFNTGSTGVALMGTFSTVAPPRAMFSSLVRLVAWKADVHHIPPTGRVTLTSRGNPKYAEGTTVRFNRISGHRDATITACPGWETYDRLGSVRSQVNRTGRPKIYLPSATTTVLRPDGDEVDESLVISASFSHTVNWKITFGDTTGEVVDTVTGVGRAVRATWTGAPLGLLLPTGRYDWRLDATDPATGHRARWVTGRVYLVNEHPDGTVLSDDGGPYAIEGGAARAAGTAEYTANFGALAPVRTGAGEETRYVPGLPLGLREGALLRGPDGTRYMWSGEALREFDVAPVDTFAALGYDPAALIDVDDSLLGELLPGDPVTDASVHPEGTVIKDGSGQKYAIDGGARRPITTLARRSWYRAIEVVAATADDLTAYPVGDTYPVRTGALVRPADASTPWLVGADGRVHRFSSWALFSALGYTSNMLLTPAAGDLDALERGRMYTGD